jgi:hypothetical protein
MPKPTVLTPEALVPSAAATPTAATKPRGNSKRKQPEAKPMPLQVRWPREEVKSVKLAAVQSDKTVSEFMLACFHAYMKTEKPGLQ